MPKRDTTQTLEKFLQIRSQFSANQYMEYFNPQHPPAVGLRGARLFSPELAAISPLLQRKFKYAVDVYPIRENTGGTVSVLAVRPHNSLIATALVAFNSDDATYEVTSPRVNRSRELWKSSDYGDTLISKLWTYDKSGWGKSSYKISGAGTAANFIHKLPPYLVQEVAHAVAHQLSSRMWGVCTGLERQMRELRSMFDKDAVLAEMLTALTTQQTSGQVQPLPADGHIMTTFKQYWDKFTELSHRSLEGPRRTVFALKMYGHEGVVCMYEIEPQIKLSHSNGYTFGLISYASAEDMPEDIRGPLMSLEIQECSTSGRVDGLGEKLKGPEAARFCCEQVYGVAVSASAIDALRPHITDMVRV